MHELSFPSVCGRQAFGGRNLQIQKLLISVFFCGGVLSSDKTEAETGPESARWGREGDRQGKAVAGDS